MIWVLAVSTSASRSSSGSFLRTIFFFPLWSFRSSQMFSVLPTSQDASLDEKKESILIDREENEGADIKRERETEREKSFKSFSLFCSRFIFYSRRSEGRRRRRKTREKEKENAELLLLKCKDIHILLPSQTHTHTHTHTIPITRTRRIFVLVLARWKNVRHDGYLRSWWSSSSIWKEKQLSCQCPLDGARIKKGKHQQSNPA